MPSATAARECHAVALLYIFLREASALSVLLRWALRRPLIVGRTNGNGSHAFLFSDNADVVGPYRQNKTIRL